MNPPTTNFETDLLCELKKHGVNTSIEDRYEKGLAHHPEAYNMAMKIGAIDWLFCNDSFCFKFGGDGDNGETLTYLLDIIFELNDKINLFQDQTMNESNHVKLNSHK